MQPGEEIEKLVQELEDVIEEAKPPLVGGGQKKIIETDEVFELLEEMREVFPQEFQEARRILKERDELLAHAQAQAESIISDAQQQAMILAGDQEVVRLAQQRADEIQSQAQQYERDTRYNAEEYVETLLAHLEDNLKSLSNSVMRTRQTLVENPGARANSDRASY